MTLLHSLTNLGAQPGDAAVLEQYYANQDENYFLNGLEEVARALVFKQLATVLPTCEPWKTIYSYMVATGDPEKGMLDGIATLDPAVQISVSGVVATRVRDVRTYQQQIAAPKKHKKTAEYIKLLDHLGYKFKYNMCTQSIEINHDRISDSLMMKIRTQVRDAGVQEVNVVEDAYGAQAYECRYHPVRDYLQDLTWDGTDVISDLSACFIDEQGVFDTYLKRWLIGSVARVFCGAQNRMLILEGSQGIGKSQFVKWLASPLLQYYFEGQINLDDKDTWFRLVSTWIWEVNEFGATARKADREKLKAFLTANLVTGRRAYARTDSGGQAMASFIGTANNESGLLSDPTGNRRFMIAKIEQIDWKRYANGRIDIDQVWAQAYFQYIQGEPWDLTEDEKKIAEIVNDSYRVVDLVEESLKRFFEIDPTQTGNKMSTLEIIEILKDPNAGNLKSGVEVDPRRLASALTKLGLSRPINMRVGGSILKGYAGISRRLP